MPEAKKRPHAQAASRACRGVIGTASGSGGGGGGGGGMTSEYERDRNRRIQANSAMLAQLGLGAPARPAPAALHQQHAIHGAAAPCLHRSHRASELAVGETVILLHLPLPSVGVSVGMKRGGSKITVPPTAGFRVAAGSPLRGSAVCRREEHHQDAGAEGRGCQGGGGGGARGGGQAPAQAEGR